MDDMRRGGQTSRWYPEFGRDARRLAVLLFVAATGMAVATLLRPAGGYRSALPLLRAALAGSGAAILLLLALAALVVAVSRRHRLSAGSVARAAGSYRVVVGALVVATMAIGAVSAWPQSDKRSVNGVTQAAFTQWQGNVVPLVVTFGHVLQALAAAEHAPRSHPLQDAATQSRRTVRRLLIGVGAELARHPDSSELHRLTAQLQRAVRSAGAAAADLAAAASAGSSSARTAARVTLRHARAELTAAALTTQKFTFQANRLGGQLAATALPAS